MRERKVYPRYHANAIEAEHVELSILNSTILKMSRVLKSASALSKAHLLPIVLALPKMH